MTMYPDIKFQNILKAVRYHFDFLFQRDYRITSAMFTDANNENWDVVIAGDKCLVKIHYQDERLCLSLCSFQLLGRTGLFDLHELVHWMGRTSNPSQYRYSLPDETEQFITSARLLETNLDEILTLFQKIHLGVGFHNAGELSLNSTPAFSVYKN